MSSLPLQLHNSANNCLYKSLAPCQRRINLCYQSFAQSLTSASFRFPEPSRLNLLDGTLTKRRKEMVGTQKRNMFKFYFVIFSVSLFVSTFSLLFHFLIIWFPLRSLARPVRVCYLCLRPQSKLTYIYIYIYMCVYIYVCVLIHTYIYIFTCIYILLFYSST